MTLSYRDASRFLTKATFGPTDESIKHLQEIGIDAWLDEQFAIEPSLHLDQYMKVREEMSGGTRDFKNYRHAAFMEHALWGKDELRQRVAYALSQILVVSEKDDNLSDGNAARGLANYYDILVRNAFDSYTELLKEVALNPCMAHYLTIHGNKKADEELGTEPDQNFARELLQLFTKGEYSRNIADGSIVTDENGEQVRCYDENDVMEMARVFTGFVVDPDDKYLLGPLLINEDDHDFGRKEFFGRRSNAAGLDPVSDVHAAINNIKQRNAYRVYIAHSLIKLLVKSNPSGEYIGHVAQAMRDHDSNLKEVIRAIFTHEECMREDETSGRLKEPLVAYLNILRRTGVYQGGGREVFWDTTLMPVLNNSGAAFPQGVLQADSVFNYFNQDYMPDGLLTSRNLIGPEFELLTPVNFTNYANAIKQYADRLMQASWDADSERVDRIYGVAGPAEDIYFDGPIAFEREISKTFFHGEETEQTRHILQYIYGTGWAVNDSQRHWIRNRIRTAAWICAISPEFIVIK